MQKKVLTFYNTEFTRILCVFAGGFGVERLSKEGKDEEAIS